MKPGLLKIIPLLVVTLLLLPGCTLPGPASPTPFTFPTPNLTHTAIFAASPTASPPPPSLTPLATATSAATSAATQTVDPIAATATQGASPTSTPAPVESVTADFLSAPPVIDGSLADWSSTSHTIDKALSYANTGWTGTADLSARYYLGWDATYLYLAVERTDDAFVQTSSGRNMFKGDDVEIQFDADLDGDRASGTLSSDDFQIGLSPGNFSSRLPEAYLWFPRSREGGLTSVTVKASAQGQGYTLEARIPWSIFGVTPAEGGRYGFVLALSDNDLAGVSTWQSMIANVSSRRLADPTTWGTLILGAPTAE
jgi:hypothetical protein